MHGEKKNTRNTTITDHNHRPQTKLQHPEEETARTQFQATTGLFLSKLIAIKNYFTRQGPNTPLEGTEAAAPLKRRV